MPAARLGLHYYPSGLRRYVTRLAVNGMKRSLDEIARGEFDPGRLREREARCATSADLREGLAAFAARRAPRFNGH